MPGRDPRDGEQMMESVARLAALNNQFYSGAPLTFSMGAATTWPGERLEAVVRRADAAMYAAKRAYHSAVGADRRQVAELAAPSANSSAA